MMFLISPDAVLLLKAMRSRSTLIDVDGIVIDARSLPQEIQEAVFQDGLIPYVPGGEDR